MQCTNLKYLDPSDFACVGIVARHCDLDKLCVATEEAKQFDVIALFCFEFVQDVLDNWNISATIPDPANPELLIPNPNYAKYQKLICGGTYHSGERTHQNLGLKKVWTYYSYARYLLINQFNDTANGLVSKNNEWSNTVPVKEVTAFSNKYRDMGREAFNSVMGYLCANKTDFPLFDSSNCRFNCGCSGACSCGGTKKMTGFKFKTISK